MKQLCSSWLRWLSIALAAMISSPCLAISQTQESFRRISISEAPPEIAQKLAVDAAGAAIQLKMGGITDDARGIDLALIRMETAACSGSFCPTYIRYSVQQRTHSVQALFIKCDEWLQIGDHVQIGRSSADSGKERSWIILKTEAGKILVTFTNAGPAIDFVKQ